MIDLDSNERAHLNALIHSDGFRVLQKIFESECQKFQTNLLNANPANPQEVLAKHALAKAGAQFYQAIVDRINEEVLIYLQAPKASDTPVDVASNLDIDDTGSIDLEAATKDLQNFF